MPNQSPRTVPARSLLEILNFLNAARRINGDEALSTVDVVHITGFTSAHISAEAQANATIDVPPSARMALRLTYRGIAEILQMGELDAPSVNKAAMYETFIANDMAPVVPSGATARVKATDLVEMFGAMQQARILHDQKPLSGSIIPAICGLSGNALAARANEKGFVELNAEQLAKLKEAFASVPAGFRSGGADAKFIERADEFAQMIASGFRKELQVKSRKPEAEQGQGVVVYPTFGKPRPASA